MSGSYKYPGFISYSHHDRKVAEWLHRALESYRVPKRLVGSPGQYGPVPARLYPIFRDREELSAGALAEQLRQAIAQSRCYILICSPHAATSRWVNEEVEHFLNVGDPACLLCLIVDGEPNASAKGAPERECFPPALRKATVNGQPLEPMAAQLDADADGRDNARLKIIAGLLGVGFDELKRRDLIARNRRLALLSVLSLGVAAVTIALAFFAVLAQREAEHSRQQGEDLISFMLGDLRGKLEPLGKLDILDAVGDRATAYFAGLDRGGDPGPRALAARAKALRQIGEVRFAQGRPADAVETLSAALKLQRELVAGAPDDNELLFELGQTEFWVGYAAWRAGQFDKAETNLTAYQQISQQLVTRDPSNRNWQIEVAYALNNLGVLASERKRYDDALAQFQQVVALSRSLINDGPLDAESTASLLGALSWEGSTLIMLGRHDEGLAKLGEYAAMLRELIRQQPDDRRQQGRLVDALSALGYAAIDAGQPALALEVATEGSAISEQLSVSDPSNVDYRLGAARHQHIAATAQFQQRHWREAIASNDRAYAGFRTVLDQDRSLIKVRQTLLASAYLAYELAWQVGDLSTAHEVAAGAVLAIGDTVPDDLESRSDYIRAHLLAMELAAFVDHDAAAAEQQGQTADQALDLIARDDAPDDHHDLLRLRTILALLRGADHIPDAARPDSASPHAYSVIRFVERHCRVRPSRLPDSLCRTEARRTLPRR